MLRVPTSPGNHGKPGKSLKKSSMLVFWLLGVSSFNYFKIHAWSTSMLLLLHSTFMLSVVKLLLKGEVGVCALKSWKLHCWSWKIMEKSWNCVFELLWEPCMLLTFETSLDPDQARHSVGPVLDPICLAFGWYSWKNFSKSWFWKNQQTTKKHEKLPSRQKIKCTYQMLIYLTL